MKKETPIWTRNNFCYIHDASISFSHLIPNNLKVRVFITDPPYNIGMKYGEVSDKLSPTEYQKLIISSMINCYQAGDDGAHFFLIHYPEAIASMWQYFTETKWKFHQWLTWVYPSNVGHSKTKWTRASRAIIWFQKPGMKKATFYPDRIVRPYQNPWDRRVNEHIKNGKGGCHLYDWWEFNLCKNVSKEKIIKPPYSNQIPEALIKRIIISTSNKGDLIADPFAGTYSTIKAAIHTGRLGWGCDLNTATKQYWPKNNEYNPQWKLSSKYDVPYSFSHIRAGISMTQYLKIIEDGAKVNRNLHRKIKPELENIKYSSK